MARSSESADGQPPPTLDRLCAALVGDLKVAGASVSVVSHSGRQSAIYSSDPTAARLEALQFELGEGPQWDAMSARAPVMVSDLAASDESRWPMFLDGARGLKIGSLFAFPMLMGAALVGVVGLYSNTARKVDREFVERGLFAAGRAAMPAVNRALNSAANHDSHESAMAPALRREVHQATGVIINQLELSATAAFSRLQGYAFVTGRPIEAIAHDVVAGRLAFNNLPETHITEQGA
ncbi:MAG: hypothetical protein CVT64_07505 [Actinobacteria bacterium HGW-Actinobacteria-4]|nr:MAG: hypothetical protein CVT64_07505 [Actinobacteria bacterium HGW-Actinobacteria-4]